MIALSKALLFLLRPGEMPRALHLQSLRAGDCSDADKCLGVNDDERCVCNVFK